MTVGPKDRKLGRWSGHELESGEFRQDTVVAVCLADLVRSLSPSFGIVPTSLLAHYASGTLLSWNRDICVSLLGGKMGMGCLAELKATDTVRLRVDDSEAGALVLTRPLSSLLLSSPSVYYFLPFYVQEHPEFMTGVGAPIENEMKKMRNEELSQQRTPIVGSDSAFTSTGDVSILLIVPTC
ncbi:hypothetical protein CVT25_007873 [Psilocybe cyanescens]|uniref:Uncharacterized protein n=1 Tax=Psilocybe cyanescens TaxID=93625 RepID=A0A409XJK3_PSICY|nr:hypothetical protein CVT25_007873 [Psilocybe cyanescens]